MDCPVDGTELRIAERSGVEIDYCPECRGIWLDRGELDKIIDRSERWVDEEVQRTRQRPSEPYKPYRGKKRKSVWSELFDV